MKKIKKIAAIWLLTSLVFTNIPVINAEWIHTERKLIHKPFWLFWPQDKTRMKDEQLCENGYSFDILDEYWNTIDKYIPEWCKKETLNKYSESEDLEFDSYWDEDLEFDSYWDEDLEFDSYWDEDLEFDSYWDEDLEFDSYWDEDLEFDSYWDEDLEEINTENTEDEEIDNFLEEIFWKKINNKLDVSNIEKQLKLWAKNLVSTVKNFADAKLELNIWAITVNLIKSQPEYNSKITKLLSKVDNEFKVDSIKNDFAKNVSNVSYSLSTYLDKDINEETKDVFRKKLVNDLKTLKKKYKVLKRKDFIVSKTLEKRGEL